MSPSPYAVLEAVVDAHRESGVPVTTQAVAASLDAQVEALERQCDSLAACDLLERTPEGIRPTVTAHELLALDVDPGDVLVLDVVDE